MDRDNSTTLQHTGKEHRVGTGLLGAIETSVTFESPTPESPPIYSRLGNTSNHKEVESVLAALHEAEDAIVTGSGMASFNLIFTSLLKPGDHVLVQDGCYGGTYNLLTKVLKPWGVETTFTPINRWEQSLKPATRMVIFESITNPYCLPQDIGQATSFARKNKLMSVCDNTFASPILCQPLSHGADLVVESATKYLNGHSDVIAGMIAGRKDLMDTLRTPHAYLGTFLATSQCAQLLRGLRTLDLRMEQHSKSGLRFAAALEASPALVERVNYGTSDNSLQKYFPRGFGGMVAVRFQHSVDVKKLLTKTRLVTNVPSLGGTETTATMPSYSTNWFMSAEEKAKYQIDDQLIRFSVGLERVENITHDVLRAAQDSLP
ncbi:MAG: aminotransferase class I/II-fold pyridoxal phosphate-dependent enzyme [Pseudomonadota bacterium]